MVGPGFPPKIDMDMENNHGFLKDIEGMIKLIKSQNCHRSFIKAWQLPRPCCYIEMGLLQTSLT